ncbi:MAG: hypothetical protein H0Z33_10790 [Bacillaceae bacterium]|nr:hypothetical protein [Bacillaceae bacterium]
MSFCCGASMIGAVGNLRHYKTRILDVPILYCPVCNRIEVHPAIEEEYEILAEYAHADHAPEVDFSDYIGEDTMQEIFDNCTVVDRGNMDELFRQQIDTALDLLSVAKNLEDKEWEEHLKNRLKKLSNRLKMWKAKRKSQL